MSTFPMMRSLTLALALLTLGTAHAGLTETPREHQQASGSYTLQDGRELVLRAYGGQMYVTLGNRPTERWELVNPDRLRSPDGRHTLHLHREASGFVDSVSLESRRH